VLVAVFVENFVERSQADKMGDKVPDKSLPREDWLPSKSTPALSITDFPPPNVEPNAGKGTALGWHSAFLNARQWPNCPMATGTLEFTW
jgi:hypothetical protein